MPQVYVSQILCFSAEDRHIFKVLKNGLRRTVQDIPYLLGGLTSQATPRGSTRLVESYQTVDDLITLVDLSESLDYALLRANHFPPSSLTDPAIRPPDTTPPYASPAPVLRARLTLVKGGALLCVAVHHGTTDITGFGALLKLWAAHCRESSSAAVHFDRSWYDRCELCRTAATTVADDAAAPRVIPELLHTLDGSEKRKANIDGAVYVTRILHFSQALLQDLKTSVNEHLRSKQGPVEWVSTSDVLTAILWSSTVWIKDSSDVDDEEVHSNVPCTIGIPVNFRARLEPALPRNYLGAAFGMTVASASRAELVAASAVPLLSSDTVASLAKIASAVRVALGRVQDASIKDILRFVETQPDDITRIKLGPRHDGISLVSWADQGVYEWDWGCSLGHCDAVRLPRMAGKRDPIVLPRVPERSGAPAGLEVIASYDTETMERFCQSLLIQRFASVRC